MEIIVDRLEQQYLDAALHHVDQRFLARRGAGQHGLAVEIVEILGDRGAFRDRQPVIQHQHRRLADRVHREEAGLLLLGGDQVDGDEFDAVLQRFLGKDNADAGGVGRAFAVVKLHGESFSIYR